MMGTGSSPARRFLLFSEPAEKSSLPYELISLKPSVPVSEINSLQIRAVHAGSVS